MQGKEKPCIVDGCGRMSRSRGLCNTHYQRWLRHNDPSVSLINRSGKKAECVMTGCHSPAQARGLCKTHYANYRRKTIRAATHA